MAATLPGLAMSEMKSAYGSKAARRTLVCSAGQGGRVDPMRLATLQSVPSAHFGHRSIQPIPKQPSESSQPLLPQRLQAFQPRPIA